jgi:hypothetical protein
MTSDADRCWEEVAQKLRRAKGFSIPTPEEAEAELDAALEQPITDEQISAMVEAAVSGELADWTPTPDLSWMGETNDSTIEDELFVLNRNRGEEDPEVDEILEEQRKEALGDDDQPGGEKRNG